MCCLWEKDLRVSVDCSSLNASKQCITTATKANAILGYSNRRIMFQAEGETSPSVVFSSHCVARILCSGQDIPI